VTVRVLVVGGTGMLGHKLVHVLSADSGLDVHTSVRRPGQAAFLHPDATYHPDVDLSTGTESIARLLTSLAPDVVINAVGAIKQRDLYADIDQTYFINGSLPHLLSHLNPNRDGRTIHFSTDCVYTGDRGNYAESTAPDSLDVYGRSKAVGEIAYGRHLTIRTSIIGFETAAHLGLVGWLLRQPTGSSVSGYSRAIFSGLPTVSLSRTVHSLIVGDSERCGLWHVASEPITKLELLQRLNAALSLGLEVTPSDTVRIDRSLDDSRFRLATHTLRPNWDTLIAELATDFASLPYAALYDALRRQAAPV